MRNLKDVLLLFSDDILKDVDEIRYLDSPEDFCIKAVFPDPEVEDTYEYIDIWLFGTGETALMVRGDDVDQYGALIWDNVINFYVKIRDIWKNNV